MDFLYQESFTPWQTPSADDKCINYLKKPQEISLKSPQPHNSIIHDSQPQPKQARQTFKDVFLSKQNKNYFIQRNKIDSRCKPFRNYSKTQLKQSHQSLHLTRHTQKRSVKFTTQQHQTKLPFDTLTNIAVKRKSLKQKIEKTKKLLGKSQLSKTSQLRDRPRQEKIFQQSLQRLLSLNKSHKNFNSSTTLNPSIIDSFFQVKNILQSHNRGKNSFTDFSSGKTPSKADSQMEKNAIFLQPKNSIAYIKKKGCNKTFYKQSNQQKVMNLPKIQILDWQKPQI